VEDQAIRYAGHLMAQWQDVESVQAYIFTNECDRPQLLKTLKQ
jgi:hypothetical protein